MAGYPNATGRVGMTIKQRVNKLALVYGQSLVPFLVVNPERGENEEQAITRTLEDNGLGSMDEVDTVVIIQKFGPGYENLRSEQGKIKKRGRKNGEIP